MEVGGRKEGGQGERGQCESTQDKRKSEVIEQKQKERETGAHAPLEHEDEVDDAVGHVALPDLEVLRVAREAVDEELGLPGLLHGLAQQPHGDLGGHDGPLPDVLLDHLPQVRAALALRPQQVARRQVHVPEGVNDARAVGALPRPGPAEHEDDAGSAPRNGDGVLVGLHLLLQVVDAPQAQRSEPHAPHEHRRGGNEERHAVQEQQADDEGGDDGGEAVAN